MLNTDLIKKSIAQVFEARFAPAKVIDVSLVDDVDHDGDPILRIQVVFDAPHDRLEPSRVRSFLRHLREPLQDQIGDRFPVMRYVTKQEAEAAAA